MYVIYVANRKPKYESTVDIYTYIDEVVGTYISLKLIMLRFLCDHCSTYMALLGNYGLLLMIAMR